MDSSALRPRGILLATGALLAALVLVAVAATGDVPTAGAGGARRPADAILDVFFSLFLVVMAAGTVLLLYLLLMRKNIEHELARRRSASRRRFSGTALAALVLVALFFVVREIRGDDAAAPSAPPRPLGDLIEALRGDDPSRYEPRFALVPVLVILALVLVGGLAARAAAQRRRRARGEEDDGLQATLAGAVDDSLDDLRAEADPRRAVIAAYARLERTLAGYGVPRRAAEAPLEYLARMLAEADVSPGAAQVLTRLFERAKFSHHEVGAEMKAEAIDALVAVRDELRAAEERRREAREAALAEARERAAGA